MLISSIYKKGLQPKRKGRMKYKVKKVKISPEIRARARIVYDTWTEALETYTDREPTRMAPELKSDTQPVIKNSLAHAVCRWIEHNPDTWADDWACILRRVAEGDPFMQKGYGNLKPPNLAWLFGNTRNGDLGINRVIDGTLDIYKSECWGGEEGHMI